MFDLKSFNQTHANANASNVVDLGMMRARKATGQPLKSEPAASAPAAKIHIGVGDWVKTPTGAIGRIQQTYIGTDGHPRGIITNGSGIRQSHILRSLTLTSPTPDPLPIREGC